MKTYEERVQAIEAQGATRSDAQGVIDAQDMTKIANAKPKYRCYVCQNWTSQFMIKHYICSVKCYENLSEAQA